MSASASMWITVRKKGDVGGPLYVAHRVANGWRYGERSDERFPEWKVMTEVEFWQAFEMTH